MNLNEKNKRGEMIKKKLSENKEIFKEDGFPGGIGTGLTLPGGYINGAPTGSQHEDYSAIQQLVHDTISEAEMNDFLNDYFNYLFEDTGTDGIDNPQNYVNAVNRDWKEFDEYDYVGQLPGWHVEGHLSDSYPDSATKINVPVNNHNEENGAGKRVIHPSKGEEYAEHKRQKWEVSPHLTLDKTYRPDAPYEEFYESVNQKKSVIGEDPNKAFDKEITYTNSKGEKKKITARNALRLPKDHPAHIQAAKIVGPSDAPANQPKPKEQPGVVTPAKQPQAPQPGQPVPKAQTVQAKADTAPKPGGSLPAQNGENPQAPNPQKLSGVELKSDAEKNLEKEKQKPSKRVSSNGEEMGTIQTKRGSTIFGVEHDNIEGAKQVVDDVKKMYSPNDKIVFMGEGGDENNKYVPGSEQEYIHNELKKSFPNMENDSWDGPDLDVHNDQSMLYKYQEKKTGLPHDIVLAGNWANMVGQNEGLNAEDYLSDNGKNFLQQSAREAGLPPIKSFDKPNKRDIHTLYRLAYPQDNGDKKTKVGELSDAFNDARDENLVRKMKKYEDNGYKVVSAAGNGHIDLLNNKRKNDKEVADDAQLKKLMPGIDTSKKTLDQVTPIERQAVATKIDDLVAMTQQSKAKGEKPKYFNLCDVTIPGTNLYCNGNLGIDRNDMPQFKGKARPGSPADKLPKNENGEVDTEEFFKQMLDKKGIKVSEPQAVPPDRLKATQMNLVGDKVAGMEQGLEANPQDPNLTAPIYVSNDGYVLDGHHRWAAIVGYNAKHPDKPIPMNVRVIDQPIKPLVKMSNDFADHMGIEKKAAVAGQGAPKLNENISESKQKTIQNFVEFANKRLKLKETPKVTLIDGPEYANAKSSLGGYSPDTKEIYTVSHNRLTADICRTIAHELVHRKQDEMGLLKSVEKDGADGSPIENQAHAVAGILMREYGRKNKQIFQEDINVDVDKGDTVLMGKFKNKKVVVKDFGKDDHGMPTINGKVATTFRMGDKGQNVFKEKKNFKEIIDGNSVICDKCGWHWKMEDGGSDTFICHKCGHNNQPTLNEGLLLEGGAAGHLAHPYEDSDLTFADMKEMINRGLIGGLDKEAPVSEKLDGQNIAFTVKNGQIRFGRNKGHVKNAGENSLDVKGITKQFAGRGGIEKAFTNSAQDLQAAVKKLSPEQVNKMFGNGSKFMSLEIILPETQNVIPYGKNVLVMHGTIEYNKDGEQIGRSTEDAKAFAEAIKKAGADKQKTFTIEGPKEIEFDNSNTKEYTQKAKQYNSELDKTIKQFGLNDKSKLEDYKRAWWNKELDNQGIKFSKQEKEGLIKRFADDDKTFGSKNFTDDKKREWFKNYETTHLAKSQKKMINPIEMVFLNSGAQVLKRVNNFLSNDTKSKTALKKDTLESIKGIKNSKDPDKIAKLQKELQRLNAIGMDNVVPSEGVVFQYKGHPYKFTGAFAPINQINGTFKFDKPKKAKNEIAIFSGRFQPFHAGHYSIYKSLVDKFGKDNVYIASSNSMDDVKSPFNFKEKKNIMTTMFGIPTNKVVQVKNPYAPVEILDKLPKDTKYVTAVSQKDAERLERGGKYFKNYDKVPDNKKKGYKDEGYFIVAPEMQLKVNGKNISGTQLRATFGDPKISLTDKKKIFQQIYPKFDKDVFAKIVVTTKKAEKAKQNKQGTQSKEKDNKKQKISAPNQVKNIPNKLLNKTIKNPDTGRMIKLKSALGYDKSSKVRKTADVMLKQSTKK
jgi:hypothetical protein